MSQSRRVTIAGVVALSCAVVAADCESPHLGDELLYPDLWEYATGRVIEIPPGAPFVDLGPDDDFGTSDDVIEPLIVGDVDLVVRSGALHSGGSFEAPWLPQSAPVATVGPFGTGDPIPFSVGASTTAQLPALGVPTFSSSFEGVPVVAAAFADLDGDGYVGITLLDGDPLDVTIEEAELIPVGRSVAIVDAGVASGSLRVQAGGPPGAALPVLIAAAAWVGPLSPSFFGGVVPDGPLLMTQVPFVPRSAPDDVLQGPAPIVPGEGVRVEIEERFEPDPTHPAIGEAFTLPVDGSAPTNDLAIAHSGPVARFGLAQRPDPARYRASRMRPIRPGVDATGSRVAYEVLQRLVVPDDGADSSETLQLVALDVLGNLGEPDAARIVEVRSSGTLRIVSPDLDGDPYSESFLVDDAVGQTLVVDDSGDALDDTNEDALVVDAGDVLQRTPVFLPDPDVDDSGLVDTTDLSIVEAADRVRLGDPGFDPDLDLDGSGRIDEDDAARVAESLGVVVPLP